MNWTISVEQDPATGDIMLPLPQELLEKMGWSEGTTLTWTDIGNGEWQLTEKKN